MASPEPSVGEQLCTIQLGPRQNAGSLQEEVGSKNITQCYGYGERGSGDIMCPRPIRGELGSSSPFGTLGIKEDGKHTSTRAGIAAAPRRKSQQDIASRTVPPLMRTLFVSISGRQSGSAHKVSRGFGEERGCVSVGSRARSAGTQPWTATTTTTAGQVAGQRRDWVSKHRGRQRTDIAMSCFGPAHAQRHGARALRQLLQGSWAAPQPMDVLPGMASMASCIPALLTRPVQPEACLAGACCEWLAWLRAQRLTTASCALVAQTRLLLGGEPL
ncbi:hypothetical protein GGR56DRAFT_183590 [Xylariaceae sp. FL0804]|nr:hypothetical protein GGR56DRAFT_183590 [Xylariaceae sp. FL0804]